MQLALNRALDTVEENPVPRCSLRALSFSLLSNVLRCENNYDIFRLFSLRLGKKNPSKNRAPENSNNDKPLLGSSYLL